MSGLLRAVRVPLFGIPVKLGSASGQLLDISASGARLRVDRELPAGSEWFLILEEPAKPVLLRVRIVRSVPPPAGTPGVDLGVTFLSMADEARQAVARLCGTAYAMTEP
jgi:hypothetical protein